MAEIGTGIVIAAGWTGRKLLGPLFDEIADDWRQRFSDRRKENLNRIGRIAEAKLGSAIDEEGEVPPRVALRVLDEGSWCDASVMAEYFGGILAASRSKDGVNDRGASWAGLVSRLSTFDVYLHYLAYEAIRRLYLGRTDINLGVNTVRDSSEIYLPGGAVLKAMGMEVTSENWTSAVMPSVTALAREDLIGPQYSYGSAEWVSEKRSIDAPDAGVTLTPSIAGIELFLSMGARKRRFVGQRHPPSGGLAGAAREPRKRGGGADHRCDEAGTERAGPTGGASRRAAGRR